MPVTSAKLPTSDNVVQRDQIDLILSQWTRERSDLDTSPMEVIGRILRTSHRIDRSLHAVFKPFGLDFGLFDVLASLRRHGPPYQLPPSELNQWCMLTSGAMTKRLDRLEEAGLVRRRDDPADRRGVLVELSAAGLALIDQAVVAHLENERRILSPLTAEQRAELAALLRPLLIHLEQTKTQGK
jgi:DNA-binding MarR family transcriptional regulator